MASSFLSLIYAERNDHRGNDKIIVGFYPILKWYQGKTQGF